MNQLFVFITNYASTHINCSVNSLIFNTDLSNVGPLKGSTCIMIKAIIASF